MDKLKNEIYDEVKDVISKKIIENELINTKFIYIQSLTKEIEKST